MQRALTGFYRRHTFIVVSIVFIFLTLTFFYRAFLGDFLFRDSFFEFYPLRLLWLWVRKGHFPLWNPYVGLGTPLAGAGFPGIFYPLHALALYLLRMPPDLYVRLYTLFHYALAGPCMFFLMRTLGAKDDGAWVSAVAYTFSGYFVCMHYAQNLLPALALMPLVLGLLIRARAEMKLGYFFLAGAVNGLMFLGGDPQNFVIAPALGIPAALWLWKYYPLKISGNPVKVPWLGLGLSCYLLTAWAAAAAEMLPSLTVLSESARGKGFDIYTSCLWSFHPLRILEFLFTRPFGTISPLLRYWGHAVVKEYIPMMLSPYMGTWTVISLFLIYAPSRMRDRRVIYFTIAIVGFLLLSFGCNLPLFEYLLNYVPGMNKFRFPEKYISIVTLSLAILAGLGTDSISSTPNSQQQKGWLMLLRLPLLVFVIAALFYFGCTMAQKEIGKIIASAISENDLSIITPYTAAKDLYSTLTRFMLLLAAGILILNIMKKTNLRYRQIIMIAFLFVDLWWNNSIWAPTCRGLYQSKSHYAEILLNLESQNCTDGDKSVDIAPDHDCTTSPFHPCIPPGKFRIDRDYRLHPPESLSIKGPDGVYVDRLDILRRWDRDTLWPNLGVIEGFENFSGITQVHSYRFLWIKDSVLGYNQLPLFNVKYGVIPQKNEPDIIASARLIERFQGTSLVQFNELWPRAYWIGDFSTISDELELVSVFKGNDFKKKVIIEGDVTGLLQSPEANDEHGIVPATIACYMPNRVEVEVDAPRSGFLVLNDEYYPGWSAELDGKEAKIFRANGLARAVWVEQGKHRVVFKYLLPWTVTGIALSAISLCAGLGLLIVSGRPRKILPPVPI